MTDPVSDTSDDAVRLWVESYQGEVLGELYFARLAETITEPALRAKIDLLRCLERCTKELLEPVIRRLGIPAEPDQATVHAVGKVTDVEYQSAAAATEVSNMGSEVQMTVPSIGCGSRHSLRKVLSSTMAPIARSTPERTLWSSVSADDAPP